MSLTEQYKKALQQSDMVHDSAQEQAVLKLEALSLALTSNSSNTLFQTIRKFSPFYRRQRHAVQGLYFWGGVGRGKTWLMDLFYQDLDMTEKYRVHFHHFMLDIHKQLGILSKQKNRRKNPLQQIARDLSKQYRLLCIDEFIVTNITDAMILSELLHALFKQQVCLVATSNRVPDDLYLNGLQRERFLPAIELIKTYTDVVQLDAGIDHRTFLLQQANIFYTPVTARTEQQIKQTMRERSVSAISENTTLNILNRDIKTVSCSEDIAWFDFDVICSAPRAAQDYIKLAQRFHTIIVTNIPILDEYSDDKTRRFIYLIDELYDRNVTLIASADAPPERLYRGNMLEFAFRRTSSRLIEMRSPQYLSQPHKPF